MKNILSEKNNINMSRIILNSIIIFKFFKIENIAFMNNYLFHIFYLIFFYKLSQYQILYY